MVLIKHEHADTGIRSHNNYGTHGKRYHHGKQGVEQCRPYIPIVLLFNKECYDKGGC